jgi:hypothetical protein
MIKDYCKKEYENEILPETIEEYLDVKYSSTIENKAARDYDYLLKSINFGYRYFDDVNKDVGNFLSHVGIVLLLFEGFYVAGAVVSISGYTSNLYSMNDTDYWMIDALTNGKYNIILKNTILYDSSHRKNSSTFSYSWNDGRVKLINRYEPIKQEGTVLKMHRYDTVTFDNIYMTKFNPNENTWGSIEIFEEYLS